jgi:hypothetical protein
MHSPLRLALCALVVAISASACDDDTPTAPTPEPPVTVTDNFTGSITRNSAATHSFLATRAGQVAATLTSLSPNTEANDLIVGFGLGTWNGTVCNVVLARDKAPQSTVIYGNVNASGELCVRVYDVGSVTGETSYEISVVHP